MRTRAEGGFPRPLSMLGRGRSRPSGERGQILVVFALMLVTMLAMGALLVDGGLAWGNERQAQTAADAAALNAAKAFAAQPDGTSIGNRMIAATGAAGFI